MSDAESDTEVVAKKEEDLKVTKKRKRIKEPSSDEDDDTIQPPTQRRRRESLSLEETHMSVVVKNSEGSEYSFRLSKNARASVLFGAYCSVVGVLTHQVSHDSSRVDPNQTLLAQGIENDDLIDVFINQTGGKPVILMYPNIDNYKIKEVKLKLNLKHWKLTTFFPKKCKTNNINEISWDNLIANKSGVIKQPIYSDNIIVGFDEHRYLFWESRSLKNFDFSKNSKIYVVPRKSTVEFLKKVLKCKLLKDLDANDMITYWLGNLDSYENNLIQFLNEKDYEKLVSLDIDPKPSRIIRIFMLFLGFDNKKEIRKDSEYEIEEDLSKIENERITGDLGKFIVFEWGGMDLRQSKLKENGLKKYKNIIL